MATLSTTKNTWNVTFEVIKPQHRWQWKLPYGTNCAICRKSIMELSAEAKERTVCAPVQGICGHTFHKDCITSWLKNNRKCPICKRTWQVKQLQTVQDKKDKDFLNNFSNLLNDLPEYIRNEIKNILNNMKDNENSEDKKNMIERMIRDMLNIANQSEEESITDNEIVTTNENTETDDDMPELQSVSENEMEEVN